MIQIIKIISGIALILASFAGLIFIASIENDIEFLVKFILAIICLNVMMIGIELTGVEQLKEK